MGKIEKLSLAIWRSDRTQAFFDGRVTLPGRALTVRDDPLEDIFARAFSTADHCVSELSLSNYLRLCVDGNCAYRGIPIFPSRSFRHGAFYVRKDGPVREPSDLVGRRVGVREYSMTAALAARGALRDQFGIESEQINWVVGDVNHREREHILLPKLFRPVPIEVAPEGAMLDDMLLDGRLDAILAYKPIESSQADDPRTVRLFANSELVEKAYFKQTGIFPIMHLVGVRVADATADPALVPELYAAFDQAQKLANADLAYEQALKIGLPWLRQELQRTVALMGSDYWPSGFAANRKVIDTMIGWSFADGMISRRIDPEELFFDSMHST